MIKVLLADDHHIVRQGIKSLLDKVGDIQVVGEVENGQTAVDFVHKHYPDVVIMDINMPLLNGIQATEQIRTGNFHTKVVILSMYSENSVVRQAISAGVNGYLLKRSLSEELTLAIRSVHQGDTYLSPGVSNIIMNQFVKETTSDTNFNPLNSLTSRERQVMKLISEGYTTKSMAELLNISYKTVEKHRTNMMIKLNLHDIAGVVRMAIKYGLIFLDE